jgi:Ca2+-binding RTX toxin-like protein
VTPEPLVITDFTPGNGGDVLDVTELLERVAISYDGRSPFSSGHLVIEQSGTDTLVKFDANGSADSLLTVVILRDVDVRSVTSANFSPLFGTSSDDVLIGTLGDDYLDGLGGDDRIYGLAGADTLIGGAGADLIEGGDGFDIVSYRMSTAAVDVSLVYMAAAQDGYGSKDTLLGIELIWGSGFDDRLTGGNPSNGTGTTGGFEGFQGFAGNDTIDGGIGFDRVYYSDSPQGVVVQLGATGTGTAQDGWGGIDTLISIEEVRGSSYADRLTGTDSGVYESFEGRAGNDTIVGKSGTDRANYQTSPAAVTVNLTTGTASDGWGGTDSLSGIENIRGSDFGDTLVGNDGNNHFDDRAGHDTVMGGAGSDTVLGTAGDDLIDTGSGLDFVIYQNSPSGLDVDMRLPSSQVKDGFGSTDTLIGVEHLMGSPYGDSVIGPSSYQSYWHVEARAGADTLDGGTGAAFNEVGFGDSPSGVVVQLDGWVGATGSLPAGYTGSALDGYGSIDIFKNFQWIEGSPHNDSLTGDAADNNIDGRGGNDTIDGGAGRDIIEFNQATAGIHVDLGQQRVFSDGQGGQDTLIGIENVDGGAWNDRIIGGDDANDVRGNAGSDFILGGPGDDTLDGGTITDLSFYTDGNSLDYGTSPAAVNINLQTGVAQDGFGSTDQIRNFTFVNGSALDDVITGSDATRFEMFQGGEGNDTINGGDLSKGSNRVRYESASGPVTVHLGAGTTSGAGGNDTLININQVRGSAHADVLIGSDRTDYREDLEGMAGNDTLDGAGGFDNVSYERSPAAVSVNLGAGTAEDGFGGRDTLLNIEGAIGSSYGDTLIGSPATDNLEGRIGNDSIFGGDGADNLTGGMGDDTLDGGAQLTIPNSADTANRSNEYDVAMFSDATSGVNVVLGVDGTAGTATGGGVGSDVLINVEYVIGSAYADSISGTNRNLPEIFRGGQGDDTIRGGDPSGIDAGMNFADYRDAISAVQVNLQIGTATGGDGNDVLIGIGNAIGSSRYGDLLIGNDGPNYFEGRGGNDTLDGAGGRDRAAYNNAPGPVTVNLSLGSASGADGTDVLISIEDVRGSAYGDVLIGSDLGNDFQARAGDDAITGLGGDDTMHGGQGNDSLDGGAGTDTARFTGAKDDYTVTVGVGGVITVTDKTANRDGTDQLTSIEKLQFSDQTIAAPGSTVTLQGMAYHWKSHALLSGVKVGVTSAQAQVANPTDLFDLRATSFDAATGVLTVEVWANPTAAAGSFDFTATSAQATGISFTSSLDAASWTPLVNVLGPQELVFGALQADAQATGVTGATKLGSLRVTVAPGAAAVEVGFGLIQVGATDVAGTTLALRALTSGADGRYGAEELAAGNYSLSVSRAVGDGTSNSGITSADALAALRIAVGLNPNPDPDGTGPKTAPAVSPYQFMAADVNGSGTVTSADALAILRMAVRLSTALPQEWFFVEEKRDFWDEVNQKFTLTRTNANWDRTITADPASGPVNLVGILKGDVNGSWAAPAGSQDLDILDPTYFERLALLMGQPNQDQWGGGP